MSEVQLAVGKQKLDSGLTLLAVRNPGVATFACTVSLRVSLKNEVRGQDGLANLVGQCLDEGTQRREALALAEAVEEIGGALDCNSSGGTLHSPAETDVKGLRLLREVITEPSFPARGVRRVQGEVLTGIRAEADDPRAVANRRFRKEVYGRHPFSRPTYGKPSTIKTLKPVDLRRFHRQWFVPQDGCIAAAGPDEPERMLAKLRSAFGSFSGRPVDAPEVPAVKMPSAAKEVHLPMKREQVHVFLGHPGIRRTDPDYYALLVMDHVLGSGPGFTSRISRRLRDEMGLCYSVHAGTTASAGEEPGCFTAYIGTSAEHRQKAIDGFFEEIERIRTTLPRKQELQDVQDYLTGSFVLGLERNANLAAYAVRAHRFNLGFDHISRYPELIRSVTRADIRRVAAKHLHPDRMIVVSAGAGE